MPTTSVRPPRTPQSTTITIPCNAQQHRIRITRRGHVGFHDHPRASLRFQALLGNPQGCAVVYHAMNEHLDFCELPEPISEAFVQRYDELCNEVSAEWRRCWHNARLLSLPYDDDESDQFWDCLGIALSDACRFLSNEIYEQYGQRLTFYQYGRNGATIAPAEWMGPAPCNQFGSFNGPLEYRESLDDFIYVQQTLAILRHINAYWRNLAASVDTWWAEERTHL